MYLSLGKGMGEGNTFRFSLVSRCQIYLITNKLKYFSQVESVLFVIMISDLFIFILFHELLHLVFSPNPFEE